MREFLFSLISPERTLVEEPVVSVILPGAEGYFGVMAGHAPLVAQLKPGVVEYRRADGSEQKAAVAGGFAQVVPERTLVLADRAELAEEIDTDRAHLALERARQLLAHPLSEQELLEARMALERARARLKATGKEV